MNFVFSVLVVCVGIYISLVAMTYFFQRNMMYFPSGYLSISKSNISGMNEIKITTNDNIVLTSWYLPAKNDKPTIISFHGNASTMEWQSTRLLPFANQGYGVLIASYRGYNGNDGKPSEQGLYDDARAHIKALNDLDVPNNKIILYGESLGSGVATQMAFEQGGFHTLILESPFTSTVDVAKNAYPYLPVSTLLKDRYENISKIKDVSVPLIIAHGQRDRLVPFDQGEKLFDAANNPKSFITIPEGAHANLGDFGVAEKYLSILAE